jgi:hypothetical protein
MLASLFGIAMTGYYRTIDRMMIMHDDGKVAGSLVRPVRLSITLVDTIISAFFSSYFPLAQQLYTLGLASYIFTKNSDQLWRMLENLDAGMIGLVSFWSLAYLAKRG